MWVNVDFLAFLRNSLVICGLTTLFSTFLASLAAYSLARFRFRGNHPFSVAVSTTQVIPGMLFFLPLYMLYIQIDDAGPADDEHVPRDDLPVHGDVHAGQHLDHARLLRVDPARAGGGRR